MSIFRPSNLNKRLVGIQTQSPGNAGQIGPAKRPYLCPGTLSLGGRCLGGACGGIFKTNESYCGVKNYCNNLQDCKGIFYCCGPGTAKYFLAADCTVFKSLWVSSNPTDAGWVTCANTILGTCGWFLPSCTEWNNLNACRTYYGSGSRYWTTTEYDANYAWRFNQQFQVWQNNYPKTWGTQQFCETYVRVIRCTST